MTNEELNMFRKRSCRELVPNGCIDRLDWGRVVRALCDEVELLRSAAGEKSKVSMYEGHDGFMDGVKSYGNRCKTTKNVCTPKSLEASAINGITYLLQDYIRRGVCSVTVDEWDEVVLVEIVVYDDIVFPKKYNIVRGMFPDRVVDVYTGRRKGEKVKLPKELSVLVALGSKDSEEYRGSEEYKKELDEAKPTQTIRIREAENGKLVIEIMAVDGYTNRQRRLMNLIAKCFPKSAVVVPIEHGTDKVVSKNA